MKAVVEATCIFVLVATTLGRSTPASAKDRDQVAAHPARDTTLRRGVWGVDAVAGGGQHWQAPRDEPAGAKVRLDTWYAPLLTPAIHVGLTDRLHLSLLAPGIAYRFGTRTSTEVVPSALTRVGGGYSFRHGYFLDVSPRLGVDIRHWFGERRAIAWGVASAAMIRYRTGGECGSLPPETCEAQTSIMRDGSVSAYLGLVVHVGEAVTLTPVVAPSLQWDRDAGTPLRPRLQLLGDVSQGVWSTPVVRWDLTSWFSLGASASGFVMLDNGDAGWLAGGSVHFRW